MTFRNIALVCKLIKYRIHTSADDGDGVDSFFTSVGLFFVSSTATSSTSIFTSSPLASFFTDVVVVAAVVVVVPLFEVPGSFLLGLASVVVVGFEGEFDFVVDVAAEGANTWCRCDFSRLPAIAHCKSTTDFNHC